MIVIKLLASVGNGAPDTERVFHSVADRSGIDTSRLRHSYFANELVEDLFGLLRNGLPPAARRLEPRTQRGFGYWALPH